MQHTIEYTRINNIYEEDNALIIELINETLKKLYLHFYLDKHLNMKLTTSIDDKIVLESKTVTAVTKKGPNYSIQILEDSNIEILNTRNETLLNFQLSSYGIILQVDNQDTVTSVTMRFSANARGFFGFGEKFDSVNQLGYQPKTYVVDHFTMQGKNTYLPMPYFLTECGWGHYNCTNYETDYNIYETEDGTMVQISELISSTDLIHHSYFLFGEPVDIIRQYHSITGDCKLPPKWSFGPWMSANGWNTQEETMLQFEKTKELQIPATVLVLEAWSDETNFYIFNGANYRASDGEEYLTYGDFSFDSDNYWTNPKEMIDKLHEEGIKVVLWQIPIIKPSKNHDNMQLTNDEKTAIEKRYCVMNADGTPYRIPKNWFPGCLILDPTNKEAVDWWLNKRRYLIEELHVDGFKTDGGEFIYDNTAVFSNGKRGLEMRNPYPNLYVNAYYNFMQKSGGITFSRAGYVGAQTNPIHWAGDQISTFEELQAQIRAGLSLGLSGVPFWGFDMAGFAGELPTTELYLRAVAMATFSPVMQFHSEPRTGQFGDCNRRSWINDRSPWNMAEVNNNEGIVEVYRKYANIRMNLIPYIYNEAYYCAKESRPLFGHLIIDYPNDKKVINMEDEYLFGRSILVAPLTKEGSNEREVYLPDGIWYDFWSNEKREGNNTYTVHCELDEIPVFVKEASLIPLNLGDSLTLGEAVGNRVNQYQNLCFHLYGEVGGTHFYDDLGNNFNIRCYDNNITIEGKRKENNIRVICNSKVYMT